jgi:hypothetical protein
MLAVVVLAANPADDPDVRAPRAGVPMEETENEEAEEQAQTVEEHREAVAEALEAGTLGKTGPIRHLRARAWAGETLAHPTADDWEPAIATDPNVPWVYVAIAVRVPAVRQELPTLHRRARLVGRRQDLGQRRVRL